MSYEKIVIELKGGKVAVLTIQEFDTDVDVDDILRIDYGNIMGEILTFPLLYNRIANLRAEVESLVQHTKMDVDIYEAQLREEKRKSLQAASDKRITDTEVESAVKLDARYAAKKKELFQVQKNFAYMDALYWSAQSKDTKLNRLSEKLRPDEFERELVEDTINGIMIKVSRPVIPDIH